MEKNNSIEIHMASNGFYVCPVSSGMASDHKEIKVFKSQHELNKFLKLHFESRIKPLKVKIK